MAKTVALFEGGFPLPQFPACDNVRVWGCPLPKQVAGEYARGYFTLGHIFQPAVVPHQAGAMAKIKPGNVPVDVAMVVVPELHSVTELYLHVDPTAPTTKSGCCGVGGNTMAGVTFEVFAKIVDSAQCEEAESMEALIEAGEDFEVPADFKGIDASQRTIKHAFLDEATRAFVEEGKTLIYGIRLLTAPTGEDITFADLAGRVALVAKVGNFEFAWQY